MIRLMIVEDEYLQRELLKRVVDWSRYDTEVVCETDSSEEAVLLAEEYQPDVIFLDIVIRGDTGIETAKKIRPILPHCQMIILTAYGTFDFAREAIRAGVCGYLLKPVNPDELLPLYLQASEKALYEKARAAYEKGLLRQKQIFEYISGVSELSGADLNSLFPGDSGFLNVIYISFPASQPKAGMLTEQIIEQTRLSYPDGIAIRATNALLLLLRENSASLFTFNIETGIFADEIRRLITESGIPGFCLARSSCYASIQDLRTAYEDAARALRTSASDSSYAIPDFSLEHSGTLYNHLASFSKILDLPVSENTAFKIRNICIPLIKDTACAKIHWSEKYHIFDYIFSLLLEENVRCNSLPPSGAISEFHRNLRSLCEFASPDQLTDDINRMAENYLSALEHCSSSPTQKKVIAATEYIHQHYGDANLSQREVADAIGVNTCYLSNIFKAETGSSFTGYLSSYRMEKASEAIRAHDGKPLYLIAEEVGYNDYYYFCRRFKHIFGVSPSEV